MPRKQRKLTIGYYPSWKLNSDADVKAQNTSDNNDNKPKEQTYKYRVEKLQTIWNKIKLMQRNCCLPALVFIGILSYMIKHILNNHFK